MRKTTTSDSVPLLSAMARQYFCVFMLHVLATESDLRSESVSLPEADLSRSIGGGEDECVNGVGSLDEMITSDQCEEGKAVSKR